MNGIPKINSRIQEALSYVEDSRLFLEKIVKEEQSKCFHGIVLEEEFDGMIRICPKCGLEEKISDKWDISSFIDLKDDERRLIVKTDQDGSIYKYRIEGSNRKVDGEY